jgi:hypothetical protein
MATYGGHTEVVGLLLEKGADIAAKDKVSAVRAVRVWYGGGN